MRLGALLFSLSAVGMMAPLSGAAAEVASVNLSTLCVETIHASAKPEQWMFQKAICSRPAGGESSAGASATATAATPGVPVVLQGVGGGDGGDGSDDGDDGSSSSSGSASDSGSEAGSDSSRTASLGGGSSGGSLASAVPSLPLTDSRLRSLGSAASQASIPDWRSSLIDPDGVDGGDGDDVGFDDPFEEGGSQGEDGERSIASGDGGEREEGLIPPLSPAQQQEISHLERQTQQALQDAYDLEERIRNGDYTPEQLPWLKAHTEAIIRRANQLEGLKIDLESYYSAENRLSLAPAPDALGEMQSVLTRDGGMSHIKDPDLAIAASVIRNHLDQMTDVEASDPTKAALLALQREVGAEMDRRGGFSDCEEDDARPGCQGRQGYVAYFRNTSPV